jgi:2-polyprenyl-6-hydroxyphenyl methylase/3-demethylubiquinone-9 3-methyltransferase
MKYYYAQKLSAERLKMCYDIAPPRIKQYLRAEADFVLSRILPDGLVLDLGCGYGRIIPQLARKAKFVVGIDTSYSSLLMGREYLAGIPNFLLLEMNAAQTTFFDEVFDAVVCIQNGISAFHVSPLRLLWESLRITRDDGIILFSSYSDKFWEYRLEWFRKQAEEGLIGEIDLEKTGRGVIVCKDGFKASTFTPAHFLSLTSKFKVSVEIVEVDESALFCVVTKK